MPAPPTPDPVRVLAVLGRGVVDPDSAVVRADDVGLTRGDGCFEGCRLVDGTIAKLDAHLARMRRSATALGIDFDEPAWRATIAAAVEAWSGPRDEAAVKLVLTRGPGEGDTPTGFVWITPVPASYAAIRAAGLKVVTLGRGLAADAFADSPWLLGGVKTLSYAINMAAYREAERRGADDVIFVSSDGVVLEAPTGTAVWASGRTLHTTPRGVTGILPGTTQELLFEQASAAGWATSYTPATVEDLHAADALWIVSSVRGPIDVVELDGKARERRPELDAEIRGYCGFPVTRAAAN